MSETANPASKQSPFLAGTRQAMFRSMLDEARVSYETEYITDDQPLVCIVITNTNGNSLVFTFTDGALVSVE